MSPEGVFFADAANISQLGKYARRADGHAGYGLGRRRFQLYQNPVAPTAAAARSSQSIGVIALCLPTE